MADADSTPSGDFNTRRFEQIAEELRPDLYRYAVWLSRDPAVAEDVVQEALLRGWQGLAKLQDHGAVKQWLLTIVRRECARHYQRKRLETVDIEEQSGADSGLIAPSEDPDVATLRVAISELDDAYREPLVLQVLMGYSVAEIAELMELTAATVLVRLFRARKKLAALLGVAELG